MEEKLDIYDEKLLQRMLFSNYECYEILGTDKVLLLNLDSKNDKCQEKNIIFDSKNIWRDLRSYIIMPPLSPSRSHQFITNTFHFGTFQSPFIIM